MISSPEKFIGKAHHAPGSYRRMKRPDWVRDSRLPAMRRPVWTRHTWRLGIVAGRPPDHRRGWHRPGLNTGAALPRNELFQHIDIIDASQQILDKNY